MGRPVLKGLGKSLIVKLFASLEIRKMLDNNLQKAILSSYPELVKSDSLLTPFDALRILSKVRTTPNFAIIPQADLYNYEILYPHLTADDLTHAEIAVLFAAFVYQGKIKEALKSN